MFSLIERILNATETDDEYVRSFVAAQPSTDLESGTCDMSNGYRLLVCKDRKLLNPWSAQALRDSGKDYFRVAQAIIIVFERQPDLLTSQVLTLLSQSRDNALDMAKILVVIHQVQPMLLKQRHYDQLSSCSDKSDLLWKCLCHFEPPKEKSPYPFELTEHYLETLLFYPEHALILSDIYTIIFGHSFGIERSQKECALSQALPKIHEHLSDLMTIKTVLSEHVPDSETWNKDCWHDLISVEFTTSQAQIWANLASLIRLMKKQAPELLTDKNLMSLCSTRLRDKCAHIEKGLHILKEMSSQQDLPAIFGKMCDIPYFAQSYSSFMCDIAPSDRAKQQEWVVELAQLLSTSIVESEHMHMQPGSFRATLQKVLDMPLELNNDDHPDKNFYEVIIRYARAERQERTERLRHISSQDGVLIEQQDPQEILFSTSADLSSAVSKMCLQTGTRKSKNNG